MAPKRIFLILLLLVLLGGTLRFYDLGKESIWMDEAVSLLEAQQEYPAQIITLVTQLEGSPYGHHLLLHYWIRYFGNSEFSVRFLSAFFGVLSIPVLFFLAKRLFDVRVALLSSLFFSTAMLQVVYSQEARLYSLFGFLALLSTLFLVMLFDSNNNRQRKYLFAYIITMTFAMYVNYVTLFLVILHLFIFYFRTDFKKNKVLFKGWLYSLSIILVLAIPLIKPFVTQLVSRHSALPAGLAAKGVPFVLAKLGLFFYMLPLLLVLFGFVLAVIFYKKTNVGTKFNEKVVIITLLILGIFYLVFLDVLAHSFSLIRHSYFMVPALYILMAKSITIFSKRHLKYLVVLAIIALNFFALFTYYSETTKAPWREAMNDFEEYARDDTIVLIDDSLSSEFLFYYYISNNPFNNSPEYRVKKIPDGVQPAYYDALVIQLNKEDDFWVIATKGFHVGMIEFLNSHYNKSFTTEHKGITLYSYEVNNLK